MALFSVAFVGFVCVACFFVHILPPALRYLGLLIFSCAFYIFACGGLPLQMPKSLMAVGFPSVLPAWLPGFFLLVFVTFATWLCGILIAAIAKKGPRVLVLLFAVASCTGLWAFCKYFGLLNIFRLHVGGIVTGQSATGFESIALPLGLSFYTLQALGYVADVFLKNTLPEKNILRYALFVSFFPALFLGPAARARLFLPQIKNPALFDYQRVSGGLFRILWGFFKKLVVADNIAVFTTYVLSAAAFNPAPMLVCAVLLFTAQLYMDFAACCDVALGASLMFGFDYAENFARPFFATSFAGLWRRWFMSFTGLLRRAVFKPILKVRFAKKNPVVLGIFVFFASAVCGLVFGLWHGLGQGFILWGLASGILFAASLVFAPHLGKIGQNLPIYKSRFVRPFLRRVFVYLVFSASLTFFISGYFQQPFFQWIGGVFKGWELLVSANFLQSFASAGLTAKRLGTIGGGLLLVFFIEHFALDTGGTVAHWVRKQGFFVRWPIYYLLLCAILLLGVFPAGQGIYQNF